MADKTCVIMRGIPGSGKTSFLRTYLPHYTVHSADNHRMVEGKYLFRPGDNLRVHNECFLTFMFAIGPQCLPLVAVDNTNIKAHELAPYVRAAEAYDYKVSIIYLPCNPEVAFNRNVHGVPYATIITMANTVEAIPSNWTQYIITPDMLNDGGQNYFYLHRILGSI